MKWFSVTFYQNEKIVFSNMIMRENRDKASQYAQKIANENSGYKDVDKVVIWELKHIEEMYGVGFDFHDLTTLLSILEYFLEFNREYIKKLEAEEPDGDFSGTHHLQNQAKKIWKYLQNHTGIKHRNDEVIDRM